MKATMIRIMKQMKHDKRSLALMLLVPIIIMSLIYFLLSDKEITYTLALKNGSPTVEKNLKEADLKIVNLKETPKVMLENKKADAVLSFNKEKTELTFYTLDSEKVPAISKKVEQAIKQENTAQMPKVMTAKQLPPIKITYIYGSEGQSTFDSLAYVFLGVLSFFFIFLISGISFIRERTSGTMERFMLTPVKRYEVVLGYTLGLGFFAVLQSAIITLYSKYVLQLDMAGHIGTAIVVMVLLAFTAVVIGAFLSIFAETEFQVMQFIPIIIVPQIFFSGLIPLETIPYHLGNLAYAMPIYYGCTALNEIFLKGATLMDVLPYCGALLGFVFLFFILNTLVLKKYRVL